MILFLYSGGTSRENRSLEEAFVKTVGKKSRITYIASAHQGGEESYEIYRREKIELGIRKTLYLPIDRPCSKKQLKDAFSSEALFLSGGNTFHFLGRLRAAGMMSHLRDFAKAGGPIAGLSAGSILITPRIDLAGLVPGEADENTFNLKKTSALALVNFEVYPHFVNSSVSVRALTKYSRHNSGRAVYAFPDGAGIHLCPDSTSFHGNVQCFSHGVLTPVAQR